MDIKFTTIVLLSLFTVGIAIDVVVDAPKWVVNGTSASWSCNFEITDISNVQTVYWRVGSQSNDDQYSTTELISYRYGTIAGPEEDRVTLDGSTFKLTIPVVQFPLDEKRYWCLASTSNSGADQDNKNSSVSVPGSDDTVTLKINDELVTGQNFTFLSSPEGAVKIALEVSDVRPKPTINLNLVGVKNYTCNDPQCSSTLTDGLLKCDCNQEAELTETTTLILRVIVPGTGGEYLRKVVIRLPESTTPACDCDGDSKRCMARACVCGQGYDCVEQQCKAIKTVGLEWTAQGSFSNFSEDEAAIQCRGMESALQQTTDNRRCCVRSIRSGSIIATFQVSLDANSNLDSSGLVEVIQTAIKKGDIIGVTVIDGSVRTNDLDECAESLGECSDSDTCRDTATGYCCAESANDECNGEYMGEPGRTCTCNEKKDSAVLIIILCVSIAVLVCGAGVVVAVLIFKNRSNRVDNNSSPRTEEKKKETDKNEDET